MNRDQFERMMAKWADEERKAMPELRPTQEMYRKVKARRQRSWFPFVNRWATVGVAAIALIVSIIVLRPQVFQPSKDVAPFEEHEEFFGESAQEETLDEAHPRPSAPAESEAPVLQREKVVLEVEDTMPAAEGEVTVDLGADVSETKDEAFSLGKKEDSQMEPPAPSVDKQRVAPAVPDNAPESTLAPESLQAPRRSSRSRTMLQESVEMDEALEMKSTVPQAAPAPEKEKGLAFEPQMLADEMKQEESGVRLLGAPGRFDSEGIPSKVFELRDGTWIDREHNLDHIVTPIKRNSAAFRDLLRAKPGLQSYTDRYYHIIINLGIHSVEISNSGKSELSPEERQKLFQ